MSHHWSFFILECSVTLLHFSMELLVIIFLLAPSFMFPHAWKCFCTWGVTSSEKTVSQMTSLFWRRILLGASLIFYLCTSYVPFSSSSKAITSSLSIWTLCRKVYNWIIHLFISGSWYAHHTGLKQLKKRKQYTSFTEQLVQN